MIDEKCDENEDEKAAKCGLVEHRAQWRVLGEAYVQQWTNVG